MTVSLDKLYALMMAAGVRRLYAKALAPNDNSKNQPYLGGDFQAIGILPYRNMHSEPGGKRPNFKASLDFGWLQDDGSVAPAPGAQLILYPDYPEVRLSGFLKGCRLAPNKLMNVRTGGRVLFLGVTDSGRIVARAAGPDDSLNREYQTIAASLAVVGVFRQLPLHGIGRNPRYLIVGALRRIHQLGWISSRRLTPGGAVAYTARNAAGTTLEAELGILPNSRTAPDYEGWEVKAHAVPDFSRLGSGRLTLMTPEPTGGYYKTEGFEPFVRRFGRSSTVGDIERVDFTGAHRAWIKCPATGLTLVLQGYDRERNKLVDTSGSLCLIDDNGTVAAQWKYDDLLRHWAEKHSQAVYVPYLKTPVPLEFWYGPRVRMGEGTDFLLFLAAISAGSAFFDPGANIKVSGGRTIHKKRSQFRIGSKHLPLLYHAMQELDLLA